MKWRKDLWINITLQKKTCEINNFITTFPCLSFYWSLKVWSYPSSNTHTYEWKLNCKLYTPTIFWILWWKKLCVNLTGRATECPDIWSNIILSMSVRVFLDEINIWTGRLSKADCTHYCGLAPSNKLKDRIEQKGWVRENSFCLTAFKLRYQFFPLSRRELKHHLKPASLQTKTTSLALLGPQIASSSCRSWDL